MVAAATNDCSDPAGLEGQGASSPVNPTTQEEEDQERRELGIPDSYRKIHDSDWGEGRHTDGTVTRTRTFVDAAGNQITVTQKLRDDDIHGEVYARRDDHFSDTGELTRSNVQASCEDGSCGGFSRLEFQTTREFGEGIRVLADAFGLLFDLYKTVDSFRRPGGLLCRSLNPAAATVGGYRADEQPQSRGLGPTFLGGDNVVAYCLCTAGGPSGQQMAHALGYGCRSEEADRLLCLLDPRNGVDGIRRECLQYLLADNGLAFDVSGTCQSVVQCPPEARSVASMDIRRDLMLCACQNAAGTFVPGRNPNTPQGRCTAVTCPQELITPSDRECCIPVNSRIEQLGAGERLAIPGLARVIGEMAMNNPSLLVRATPEVRQQLLRLLQPDP
jgi:hypothetical protein